ncbi:chemotaxis protein histidine kinase CheA [Neisseria sp. HSC-16F19]|nr:hypothetical protein [Neisseria sp. HSC-16F19]MCP2041472.1 chemotaxis protein histidine kinase CheA [Neisseria sp. HSC-16F19]
MMHQPVSWLRRLSGAAVVLLLGACALPNDPAREAVGSVREQKKDIPYQEAETAGNTSLFGFRSLPKRAEAPAVTVSASRPVAEVSQCLQGQLKSRFNLPEDFFQVKNYANKAQSVSLVNPFTKKEGLMMDVESSGVSSSTIKLYANGATLSRAWQQLPARCGGANAAVLAKAETPAKAAAEPRRTTRRDSETAAAPARSNTAAARSSGSNNERRQTASATGSKTKTKTQTAAANNQAKAGSKTAGTKSDKKAKQPAAAQKAVKPADKKAQSSKAKDNKAKDSKQAQSGKSKAQDTKAKDSKAKSAQSKAKDSKAQDNKAKAKSTAKDSKAAATQKSKSTAASGQKSGKKETAPVKPKPKQKSKS